MEKQDNSPSSTEAAKDVSAAVDPFAEVDTLCPDPKSLSLFAEPAPGPCWLYAQGELEAWFFLLSRDLFGLTPIAPGWSRFTLHPGECVLRSATATVPTPNGSIIVEQNGPEIQVEIPPQAVFDYDGDSFTGPGKIKVKV